MFGEGVYLVVDATNLYYGGTDIAGIYITNLLTVPSKLQVVVAKRAGRGGWFDPPTLFFFSVNCN